MTDMHSTIREKAHKQLSSAIRYSVPSMLSVGLDKVATVKSLWLLLSLSMVELAKPPYLTQQPDWRKLAFIFGRQYDPGLS